MYFGKKIRILILLLLCISLLCITVSYGHAAFIATNRDTKQPPDQVTYDITSFDEYELLYETETMVFYFREDRDIIAMKDKRSGYAWKTGLDIPYNSDINDKILEASTEEEVLQAAIKQEDWMSSTYIAIANSLITVEYSEAETIKNISSASKTGVESSLVTLNNNPATRRLDVNFMILDLQIKVYITFHDSSITYEIRDEDIQGKGRNSLVSVNITPFLGASGGKYKLYNPETQMYDIIEEKYRIPGYILAPDGSGSLIRFHDNSSSFSIYYGDVYGPDYAQNTYYRDTLSDAIPLKNPVIPVFGVSHGDKQAAFVAYADSAAEYMQIVVRPDENMTHYNWAYPRFVYNVNYFQVYNKKGDGYFTLMKEPNRMDIKMTYQFLAGDGKDGTPSADYIGMAAAYREHLINTGVLTKKTPDQTNIPLRLDFIMADSKKGIVGTEQVVVTTVDDVRDILDTMINDHGISNINSGIYGWQRDGRTLSKPNKAKYSTKIGSKNKFINLFEDFARIGVDISYANDYTTINKQMMSFLGTAARHVNSWYIELDKRWLLPFNTPVYTFGYATPKKSADWFQTQFKRFSGYSESMTVEGISNTLISHYTSEYADTTVTQAIKLYEEVFREAGKNLKLNLNNPNMYLWKYTDRYLQSPVGTSQYVYQTDAVPFIQMLLHGTMEVYAPYSNFSFYTQSDILRMIDYNLSPSFILSKEPSYNLSSTPSADLYSTEFEQYEQLITNVYSQVNEILSKVIGFQWTNRRVLADGIICNSYQRGEEFKLIIINFSEESFLYEKILIPALSAVVIKDGEVSE